jgi:hypothetical protein
MNQVPRVDDHPSVSTPPRGPVAGALVANGAADPATIGPQAVAAAMPAGTANDDDVSSLPVGHPAWQRDALSVSSRVRAILATLRPVVVRVVSFWDHAVRAVRIGSRTVEIDPSGCYRVR